MNYEVSWEHSPIKMSPLLGQWKCDQKDLFGKIAHVFSITIS